MDTESVAAAPAPAEVNNVETVKNLSDNEGTRKRKFPSLRSFVHAGSDSKKRNIAPIEKWTSLQV